jgi:flagellar biosynthesis activator protein FlaF
MSIQAYQRASAQAENPRDAEYRIFGLVTAGLISAQEKGRDDLAALSYAIDRNRRLWSLLAQDCAQPGNALAPAVKAHIISLSMWVSKHSSAVIREGEDIAPLIDVNRSIMQGLSGAEASPAAAAAAV